MIQIWRPPERLLVNAIFAPSGDQAGSASSAVEVVSRAWPVPSLRIE
jgi:hypothetical protein